MACRSLYNRYVKRLERISLQKYLFQTAAGPGSIKENRGEKTIELFKERSINDSGKISGSVPCSGRNAECSQSEDRRTAEGKKGAGTEVQSEMK